MKLIRPALMAAVLLTPCLALAQTPRPDRSVDTDGTNTSDDAGSATRRAGSTGATRNEPNESIPRAVPGASDDTRSPEFSKDSQQLTSDIASLREEITSLQSKTNTKGREKLDTLSTRLDQLQERATTATAGSEKDFNENKHKYKNELNKIKRELRDVRKYRAMTPDSTQSAPTGMEQ